MRMRDDDRVEIVNSVTQEERHDDAFADCFGDGAAALRAAFEPAAGVDEERVAARRLNHDRVGLADVEHGDAQAPVHRARRPEHVRRCERERRNGQRLRATAPEQRRCYQRRVVGGDGPRRRGRRGDRRTGERADGSNDGEHPREQPGVTVGESLRQRRGPRQRELRGAERHRCCDARNHRNVRGDGIRRELQEDRRAERPDAELRRDREHERFANSIRQCNSRFDPRFQRSGAGEDRSDARERKRKRSGGNTFWTRKGHGERRDSQRVPGEGRAAARARREHRGRHRRGAHGGKLRAAPPDETPDECRREEAGRPTRERKQREQRGAERCDRAEMQTRSDQDVHRAGLLKFGAQQRRQGGPLAPELAADDRRARLADAIAKPDVRPGVGSREPGLEIRSLRARREYLGGFEAPVETALALDRGCARLVGIARLVERFEPAAHHGPHPHRRHRLAHAREHAKAVVEPKRQRSRAVAGTRRVEDRRAVASRALLEDGRRRAFAQRRVGRGGDESDGHGDEEAQLCALQRRTGSEHAQAAVDDDAEIRRKRRDGQRSEYCRYRAEKKRERGHRRSPATRGRAVQRFSS